MASLPCAPNFSKPFTRYSSALGITVAAATIKEESNHKRVFIANNNANLHSYSI